MATNGVQPSRIGQKLMLSCVVSAEAKDALTKMAKEAGMSKSATLDALLLSGASGDLLRVAKIARLKRELAKLEGDSA